MENKKRNQKEILELKSKIIKMKILLEEFKGRLEQAGEIVTKLEDTSMEIFKQEQKGKKKKD